jgi:LysM repeat protein
MVANNAQLCFTPRELEIFNATHADRLVRVKVNPGESLVHIAKQIGMDEKGLLALNPQFNYRFTPPDRPAYINIPARRVAQFRRDYKPGKQRNMFLVHKVKRGETLYAIARRYGIGYRVIASFNKIKQGRIYPRQELVVPVPKKMGAAVYEREHKVRPGETLYAIARRFGVKVAAIKRRNGLRSNIIHVGDKLVIPN